MYQIRAEPELEPEPEPQLQPRLFITIDFMGIGSGKEINSSTSTRSANSHHQLTNNRRSMQSCLRKIKPHMLHQLLFSNPEAEISEAVKTLELFPQHTPLNQSNCKEGDIVDRQSPSINDRIKFAEAAPFYSGVLNVCSEKGGNGNGNGNGNGLQQVYPASEKGVSSIGAGAGFSSEGAGFAAKTPPAELPISKKLSLQRFLQKRKDRLYKLRLYTT